MLRKICAGGQHSFHGEAGLRLHGEGGTLAQFEVRLRLTDRERLRCALQRKRQRAVDRHRRQGLRQCSRNHRLLGERIDIHRQRATQGKPRAWRAEFTQRDLGIAPHERLPARAERRLGQREGKAIGAVAEVWRRHNLQSP